MIYSVTFNALRSMTVPSYYHNKEYDKHPQYSYIVALRPHVGKFLDSKKILAEIIKESEENSWCFILTNSQLQDFDKWITENELERYVAYRMERAVTNENHIENGRNLTLVVMATKQHVWRDMFSSNIEWSEA